MNNTTFISWKAKKVRGSVLIDFPFHEVAETYSQLNPEPTTFDAFFQENGETKKLQFNLRITKSDFLFTDGVRFTLIVDR